MKSAASWPEPASILLMVLFTFVGGAAAYRAKLHVAVMALLDALKGNARRAVVALVDLCVGATCVFMMVWGTALVRATWHQSISEFPGLSAGLTYAPIPLAGLITLLFLVEHVWLGAPPESSLIHADAPRDLE
jgi:TRAP-type C4-dicarboxylate transport system permease small subunit